MTPEAVKAFAVEYGIGPEPQRDKGYTPTTIQGGQASGPKNIHEGRVRRGDEEQPSKRSGSR